MSFALCQNLVVAELLDARHIIEGMKRILCSSEQRICYKTTLVSGKQSASSKISIAEIIIVVLIRLHEAMKSKKTDRPPLAHVFKPTCSWWLGSCDLSWEVTSYVHSVSTFWTQRRLSSVGPHVSHVGSCPARHRQLVPHDLSISLSFNSFYFNKLETCKADISIELLRWFELQERTAE